MRAEVADLRLQKSGQAARLAEDRRIAGSLPLTPKPDALDRSRAVSRLRTTLARLATGKGVTLDEFQASTEEAPYLTAYASDGTAAGWTQVPVKAALRGRATALMGAITGLGKLGVPFEIDTLELSRRSTDTMGMATVSAQIGMRVLVYRGEG